MEILFHQTHAHMQVQLYLLKPIIYLHLAPMHVFPMAGIPSGAVEAIFKTKQISCEAIFVNIFAVYWNRGVRGHVSPNLDARC